MSSVDCSNKTCYLVGLSYLVAVDIDDMETEHAANSIFDFDHDVVF